MDRSFLSQPELVAATRNWVCLRAATYESAEEAKFLRTIFTRGGDLENTVFGLLAPDGKTKLGRTGRSPQHLYGSVSRLASSMETLAAKYPKAEAPLTSQRLPVMKNLELALNVASCDGLPVLVVAGEDSAAVDRIRGLVAPVIWSEALIGQYICAVVTDPANLALLTGLNQDALEHATGILAVQPDQFGLSGKVLSHYPATITGQDLSAGLLKDARAMPRPVKEHRSHVGLGRQLGVDWKTAIPVEDKMSLRAQSRQRGTP